MIYKHAHRTRKKQNKKISADNNIRPLKQNSIIEKSQQLEHAHRTRKKHLAAAVKDLSIYVYKFEQLRIPQNSPGHAQTLLPLQIIHYVFLLLINMF